MSNEARQNLLREMAKEFDALNPTDSLEKMADVAVRECMAILRAAELSGEHFGTGPVEFLAMKLEVQAP
jgi:hypothetical protein